MEQYSYKIQLYPNHDQKEFLTKQFGCCRFVYNYMLDLKIKEYKVGNNLSKIDLIKKLTLVKKQDEYAFLNEVFDQPLIQSACNADTVFSIFVKKYNQFPKFKSKKTKQSFTFEDPIIAGSTLWLPKHGSWIRFSDAQTIESKLKKVTISKDTDELYWLSILTE